MPSSSGSILPGPITDLAGRTVRGSLHSGGAAAITVVLGFARLVLLARLLLPEHFGVVALATFFVGLGAKLTSFGLNAAMIHRQEGGETLTATYLSLQLVQSGLTLLILFVAAPLLQSIYPQMHNFQQVVWLLAIGALISNVSGVQETLMRKELAFSRLALTAIIDSIVVTLLAPFLAWTGWGVWALVAEPVGSAVARCAVTWGPFRQWPARLGWDRSIRKFFWQYGKPVWVRANLRYLLDTFDDFWIGTALGKIPLGYYSRAYMFSRTPRRVVAMPLVKVFGPVFAHLQTDRKRLSQVFNRTAYVLLRLIFFGAGMFALIIPEFVDLVIGPKWLPMVWTFRLLLFYAAFDAYFMLIESLMLAVGKPVILRNVAIVQSVISVPMVIVGASLAGIKGVALAVNLMLLIGLWVVSRELRRTVDCAFWHLALRPIAALIFAYAVGSGLESVLFLPSGQIFFVKMAVFAIIYTTILMVGNREHRFQHVKELWKMVRAEGF